MEQILRLTKTMTIPAIGFGTWKITGNTCTNAVKEAISCGYRHIDTADAYGNHKEVGRGITQSKMKRQDIFLTTKVWRDNLAYDDVIASAQRFLEELQTDYIDLLLIHWPNPAIPLGQTLGALQELKNKKIIRAIGVSNFTIPLLMDAIETEIPFVMNQVEFHPSLNQKELQTFCDAKKICITAYSPIAQGADLKIPLIRNLAIKYGRSPAQIILNWLNKKRIVVIPRSTKKERIQENINALSFALSGEDSLAIDSLPLHNRIIRPGFSPFKANE